MAVYRRGIRRAVDVEAGFDANQGARVGFGTECQHPAGFVAFGRVRQESARSVHRDRGIRRRQGARVGSACRRRRPPCPRSAGRVGIRPSRAGPAAPGVLSQSLFLPPIAPVAAATIAPSSAAFANPFALPAADAAPARRGTRSGRARSAHRYRRSRVAWPIEWPQSRRNLLWQNNRITLRWPGSSGGSARRTSRSGWGVDFVRRKLSSQTDVRLLASRPAIYR